MPRGWLQEHLDSLNNCQEADNPWAMSDARVEPVQLLFKFTLFSVGDRASCPEGDAFVWSGKRETDAIEIPSRHSRPCKRAALDANPASLASRSEISFSEIDLLP